MAEIVTGSQNSIAFWESKTLTLRNSFQPFGDRNFHLSSLSWSSSNTKLAVFPKWGDKVALCEIEDSSINWSLLSHKDGGNFTCGALMHNSHYLLTGTSDANVHVWDLRNSSIMKTFKGHTSPLTSVAHNASDRVVVSGAQNGWLLMHNVGSGQMINLTQDEAFNQPISRLRFSAQEKTHFGAVSEDGTVSLWSAESQRLLAKLTPAHGAVATDLCFSPSNNMLMVSVGLDARIRCWDIQQRRSVTVIPAPVALSSVVMMRDGYTLVAGGADGKLYSYELRAVKSPRQIVEAHQAAVTCIAEQWAPKSSSRRSSSKASGRGSRGTHLSPAKPSQKSSAKSVDTPDTATGSLSQGMQPTEPSTSREHEKVLVAPGVLMQTPYMGGAHAVRRWRDSAAMFTTPAVLGGQPDSSGIFSPLEAHLTTPLVTPFPNGKATAAVLPTMRMSESTGRHKASEGSQPPGQTVHPSAAPTSELFSPLEVQTTAAVERRPRVQEAFSRPEATHTRTPLFEQSFLPSLPAQTTPTTIASPSHDVTSSTPDVDQLQEVDRALPETKEVIPQHARLSEEVSDGSPVLHTSVHTTVDDGTTAVVPEVGSHPRPPTSTFPLGGVEVRPGVVQLQFVENLIKDAHEELRYSLHRDMRALSLDMFRQFFIQQQQFTAALALLNEKIDRLSDENRKLQEMFHQYMPKH